MAQPIKYRPAAETEQSARAQFEELLQVLADTGTLRLLKDLLQRAGQVGELISERADSRAGRNALGNVALFATALTELRPDDLERAGGAARDGLRRAQQHARHRPPGLLRLVLQLRRENVRRALVGLLAIADGVGELMRPERVELRAIREQPGGRPAVAHPLRPTGAADAPAAE